jgi:hypothetical protein
MTSQAQHTTAGNAPGQVPDIREFIWERLVALLDVSVVVYLGLMALYLVTGPIDAGVFTVRGLAKPLLLTIVLVSLRAAVSRSSWLSRLAWRTWRRAAADAAALAGRVSWAPAAVDAGVALLATRIVGKAIGFVVIVLVPPVGPRPFEMPFEHVKFAETFAAWDSGWYFGIAQRGYYFDPDGQSSIPFFPLYPLLMRIAAWPFGGTDRSLWLAGIVISYVSFFVALVLLHRLTERFVGTREAARRTVLYVAVFPFSYFFSRVYTESLFLLVTVAAVYAAFSSRWRLAGFFGALAALTRPNGLLIIVPLGILALQTGASWRERLRHVSPLIAVPSALGLYCCYVYSLTGDAFAWLDAQKHWGYSIGNRPWATLQQLLETLETRGIYSYLVAEREGIYASLHASVALTFIALTPSVFSRLGIALGSYVAVSLLVPLSGNALEGLGRYAATMFPVFILLGTITSQRFHDVLLIVGSLGLVLLITLFVTLHPIY